jgi:uncharacterized protein (TIGR04562 family)
VHPSSNDPRLDFSWDTLRLFLEGFSPVDLEGLGITSRQEAEEFIAAYGYELEEPKEMEEALQIHREALGFISQFLCPALDDDTADLEIPEEVSNPPALADLLLLSSDRSDPVLSSWACAVLRVMHTISHANLAARTPYFREVQEQILGPFKQHIFPTAEEPESLGQGPSSVPLKAAFFKRRKSRESLILKLLHKPDNVASEVYDRIGIKLVTPTKLDALLALKYLRKQNLVSIPLLTPGRSRNTLVDLPIFREAYESLTAAKRDADEESADLEFFRQLAYRPSSEAELLEERMDANPHSSKSFRAIQFTCRKLVKVIHPAVTVINQLRRQTGNESLGEEVLRHYPKQLRFTFPFEIQITDWENYLVSRQGESSHVSYKRRQLVAARRRILGGVLLDEAKKKKLAGSRARQLLSLAQTVEPEPSLPVLTNTPPEEILPPVV